jgi:tetratricopeptide (TPR) repeat protein
MNIKKITFLIILSLFILSNYAATLYAADNSLEQGIEQYKNENYEEALGILKDARTQQPDSSVAAFYLGLAYKQLKEYQLAEKNLRDSLQLTPPVKDAYLELAEVLYTLEQYNEAEGWVVKSEQEGVKPAKASFLRGLILLKRGRTEEAISNFNKAKELDPSLSQPAGFQIALAQIQAQQFDEAQRSLKAIEEIDPASDLASFAKEYEKSLSRTMAMYKPWRFTVGVAYQFDDNVILKPSAEIPGVDITGERDSSIVGTLGVIYSPRLTGPYFLNCQYNLYTDTYFKVNSHNLIVQSLSLTPGINIRKGSLSLPLSYSYIMVHERPYMGDFSVKPALQIAFKPDHIGRVSLGYEKRNLIQAPLDRDEDRDGNVFSASAGYIHPFAEGRGVFNLIYEFTIDDTDGRNWDNIGNRISLGLLLPNLVKEINLVLSGDVFLQNYQHTNTVFEVKRNDRTYTASATLLRELFRGVFINLQYSYTRADSNITVYDYDRNIYTAGIEYRF